MINKNIGIPGYEINLTLNDESGTLVIQLTKTYDDKSRIFSFNKRWLVKTYIDKRYIDLNGYECNRKLPIALYHYSKQSNKQIAGKLYYYKLRYRLFSGKFRLLGYLFPVIEIFRVELVKNFSEYRTFVDEVLIDSSYSALVDKMYEFKREFEDEFKLSVSIGPIEDEEELLVIDSASQYTATEETEVSNEDEAKETKV